MDFDSIFKTAKNHSHTAQVHLEQSILLVTVKHLRIHLEIVPIVQRRKKRKTYCELPNQHRTGHHWGSQTQNRALKSNARFGI